MAFSCYNDPVSTDDQDKPRDLFEFVALWRKRAAILDETMISDLRNKDLAQRLKAISYFNGIFEEHVSKSAAEHASSGLVEYQRLTSKLRNG